LAPDDAGSFLRQQAERILLEGMEHRRASAPVISKSVKDW
jgi:hypothetical protein